MQREGKSKIRSHNTSYCLIEVVSKGGLTNLIEVVSKGGLTNLIEVVSKASLTIREIKFRWNILYLINGVSV